jgi:hypothetical protein
MLFLFICYEVKEPVVFRARVLLNIVALVKTKISYRISSAARITYDELVYTYNLHSYE